MNFMITVDDSGELKAVGSWELSQELLESITKEINEILDRRAIESGDYDPNENENPIVVVIGNPT